MDPSAPVRKSNTRINARVPPFLEQKAGPVAHAESLVGKILSNGRGLSGKKLVFSRAC